MNPHKSRVKSSLGSFRPGVTNRWNRWSIKIDINRWQSISINRLILIIDDQSMKKIFVTLSIGIDCHRLLSIITMQFSYSLNMKIRHIYFENMTFSGLISLGTSAMKVLANRYQSLPIDINRWTFFLWLSIGHRLADTNRYQLTNFIDWYPFIDWICDHRFHWLVTPGLEAVPNLCRQMT